GLVRACLEDGPCDGGDHPSRHDGPAPSNSWAGSTAPMALEQPNYRPQHWNLFRRFSNWIAWRGLSARTKAHGLHEAARVHEPSGRGGNLAAGCPRPTA